VNGTLREEFGGETFSVFLSSASTTVSVVPCSWFTNTCGTPIHDIIAAQRCNKALLKVYLNPAEDILNIAIEQFNKIEITDVFGKIVASIDATEQRPIQIATTNLANGMYFVKIITENEILVEKIIIEK
jgi:hypothetical protein